MDRALGIPRHHLNGMMKHVELLAVQSCAGNGSVTHRSSFLGIGLPLLIGSVAWSPIGRAVS